MSTKNFFNQARERTDQILGENFEISTAMDVPRISDLEYANRGKLIETSVLFVDLRGSTDLNEEHRRSTVAKIHKCFLNEMVRAARHWGCHVRGFAGDRIMVISPAGDLSIKKALNTAITMLSIVMYVLNPKLKRYDESISCGIGIDYGKMLVAKVGMRRDPHNSDLIWTGDPASIASKLADEAIGNQLRVTDRFYDRIPNDEQSKKEGWWKRSTQRIGQVSQVIYCANIIWTPAQE